VATLHSVLNLEKLPAKKLKCLSIVYGEKTINKSPVYDWLKRLKNGQESLEGKE